MVSLFRDVQLYTMMSIFLILYTLLDTGLGDTHGPCQDRMCPDDSECKVRYTPCQITPCPQPYSQCVLKDKPGLCPPNSSTTGKCVETCDTDASCPGDLKCCGRCSRECKLPFLEKVKPGLCPPISQCPDTLPYCPTTSRCQTDLDCVGVKKCCGKCPRLCIDPENGED